MIRFRIKAFAVLALVGIAAYEWESLQEPLPVPQKLESVEKKSPLLFRGGLPAMVELPPLNFDVAFSDLLVQAQLDVSFIGNGRESLKMTAINRSDRAVLLKVIAGQVFKSSASSVVIVRSCEVKVNPGETVEQVLQTAALSSRNVIGSAVYTPAKTVLPKLNDFLSYLDEHPEISAGSIQTAVLALTENLPAGAFARYSRPDADIPSPIDTTPFRVDTPELMSALIALRDVGIPDSQLAITVDPQLKSEAMIDPMAHALAMQYYRIPFESEWSYWKNELLQGDPAIRHYALYGIARFYPDIALQMLPKWARAANLSETYRQSAMRALAETGRPEALSVLQQFEFEFGGQTELGKVAHQAAQYLDARLNQEAPKMVISFKRTKEVSLRQPIVEIGLSAVKKN